MSRLNRGASAGGLPSARATDGVPHRKLPTKTKITLFNRMLNTLFVPNLVASRAKGPGWRIPSQNGEVRVGELTAVAGVGLGVMVSVGDDGNTCGIEIATGQPLAAGKIPASVRGKPSFVGDAFMVATGDVIHTSTDGITWATRSLPSDVRFELVARDSSGTYAGVSQSGDVFYFSDDDLRWTKAKAPAGNALVNLIAGAGSTSTQCPLP